MHLLRFNPLKMCNAWWNTFCTEGYCIKVVYKREKDEGKIAKVATTWCNQDSKVCK